MSTSATARLARVGLPPFGYGRIFDMSDEHAPVLVSNLMLEVTLPANCPTTLPGTVGTAIFSYDSHYCSVDNPLEARLIACGYFESGMRVFDISDPSHPKEVAYYNPPSQAGQQPNAALIGLRQRVRCAATHRRHDSIHRGVVPCYIGCHIGRHSRNGGGEGVNR